ncbi:MAG: glycogen debranching protein GlgX [Betaproteobacteria bacterium]|nr:glycogen debranching protein GlgX [Betaproteobacteria bacterium]
MQALPAEAPAAPSPPRLRLECGRPWPLGATVDADGVNFAVFSAHASRVELSLFDEAGEQELARLPLPARSGDVWHGHLPRVGAGLVYGLRADGPWRPEQGHRFNPHKLLLDPWAREIVVPAGGFDWRRPHGGADHRHPLARDERDNARWAHKARVVADEPALAWQRPQHASTDLVLYEMHVRSFTRLMPGVPEAARGTYAGLASDAAIAHLKRLGITAVSLLPVQHKLDEMRLAAMGLVNHWGYNTLGYFAPEPRYASSANPREEFRAMVRCLHAAGIEVVIDVVFNHTAEGDETGPTLAWRGLDNASWYRLPPAHRAGYENWSGCGNTLDVQHPRVLQFVLDSLRHWVQQMGVDGFRFDLAPVLGREEGAFERRASFFKAVAQDPVLQGARLIAEPWDLGPGGYQLGQFPDGWCEWNDRFRDTARAFWLGGDCTRGELALRLAGSADLFQPRQRSPLESVNYVVSHDGFTLADLVAYDLRHNEANGENNRDGHAHNLSWNCGFEGPTTDPEVQGRRARLQRALLAVTLLAQGTPMLAAGAETGHTQHGNNNAYCQDNAISWLDWARADDDLIEYVAHLVALRRRWLPLAPRWYSGLVDARGRHDLAWLRRTGEALTIEHWNNRTSRILGAHIGAPGRGGGAALLLLLNGRDLDADFVLPAGRWVAELDSVQPRGRVAWRGEGTGAPNACAYPLAARSVVLLREAGPDEDAGEADGGQKR